ncbi:MAG: hypothetical protein ABIV51_03995 [Saprospiraceae bacterium]
MKKTLFITLIVGLTFTSCKQNEVDGILIGSTLCENQSFSDNRQLRQLIHQTLGMDKKALAELSKFRCGGGAGCYDLGFIVTQIIYRIGAKEFATMLENLTSEETNLIEGLIMVGLEYGDNDKDGEMDDKRIENEFPELQKRLRSK